MVITNKAVKTESEITAILGPTNTGKTYDAIQRMLRCDTGVIGFPLRLLARENYEAVAKIKGKHTVALITGEEKIIPRHARYFLCTVEAMPVEQDFEFLAVDEIQLCADPERGHIFTDRLLRARGTKQTLFMGADTIRPLMRALVPDIYFETRERLSSLIYAGYKKLTRLPKRTAIVCFSIDDVYNTAELIRRQCGGTAVVLGALSPRTRNAQVEMYQSGEVDYMVATDAIGMGLNMDIHHIALAATRKYDGHRMRPLRNAELAQIAGRAGRFTRDGTFGVTGPVPELDQDITDAIQSHRFKPLQKLYWRNANLSFNSLAALRQSLDQKPDHDALMKGRPADDYLTFVHLSDRANIAAQAQTPDRIRLLWDVCQIPDFRQTLSESHQELLATIFEKLCEGRLDEDWVRRQINRLDNDSGDVDALMNRIAHIRTWTYIAYRADWIERTEYWQDQTRAIEDKLSDALHDALTRRFVDYKATALMRSMEPGKETLAGIKKTGDVIVEGHSIGQLRGFRFIPDETIGREHLKMMMSAARNALKGEMKRRINMILHAQDTQFTLQPDGTICWQSDSTNPLPGEPIGTIRKGENVLKPVCALSDSDLFQDQDKQTIQDFVTAWLQRHIETILAPLFALNKTDAMPSAAVKGIAFQLYESMGIVPREDLQSLLSDLSEEDRQSIRALKIKTGPILVFLYELNKPAAVRLRGLLWCLFEGHPLPAPVPADGIVSCAPDQNRTMPTEFYRTIGYPHYGPRIIRIDMLDRVINLVYDGADKGQFKAQHTMAEWLGCSIPDLYTVLESMGHKKIHDPADVEEAIEEENAEKEKSPQEKPQDKPQEKPELATFQLKKGKAHSNKALRPLKEFKDKKPEKQKGKRNKKKDKLPLHSGPKLNPANSPFAVLQNLKFDDKEQKKSS